MIIIELIPKHSVIRFATQYSGVYKNPSEDPRAFEENKRLRENLNRMGLNTLKHNFVFESSGSLNWSRTTYNSSDYCFYVTADSFSSLNNIVEKVLDGFAEFKVAPGASFSSSKDIKTYMYAFDSQTYLSASKKQLLEEYYDHSVTPQISNK